VIKLEIQAQQEQEDERSTRSGGEDRKPELAKRRRHTTARVQAHARKDSMGTYSGDGSGTLGTYHPAWLCPIPDGVYTIVVSKPAGNSGPGAGAALRRAVSLVLRHLLDDLSNHNGVDILRNRCHHCLAQIS